ncbi:MAG: hypothetical protein AB2L20_19925 [Mangrovibacterium sp.]
MKLYRIYDHFRAALFILIFLQPMIGLGKSRDTDTSLQTDTSGNFITFTSPYLAIAFAKEFPMLSYFSIESGGRSRRLLDRSLLRPGLGGTVVCGTQNSFGIKAKALSDQKKVSYRSVPFDNGKIWQCEIEAADERRFTVQVSGKDEQIQGEFFRIATAPDISPVTIWAERSNETPSDQYDRDVSFYSARVRKFSWKLPAILHFPDYGLVRVEAADTNVYMQEHFVPDYSNMGLAFGPFNRGPHSGFRAITLGAVILSFHSGQPTGNTKISFTVMDENYPKLAGCDFSDSKFDGLKRCWQNAFPVNPAEQCMGDNLLLSGVAHLAMIFKSDMNVFTPALPGKESVSDALGRSLETTFSGRVDPKTGRINDYGWESTEVSLITLYNYLLVTNDWPLVKRNLENIRKAVRSVMANDTDGDGIVEEPFHGNFFDHNRKSLNWWDDFAFGHKDAYVNLLAYRALMNMREMFTLLELDDEVKKITAFTGRFRTVFHKTFFNPETGVYGGWISQDGRMHDYMFTFINGIAINYGLADQDLAKSILQKLLDQLEKEGYDFVYGVPGPAMEVAREDRQGWEEMSRWGRYENGGLCGQVAYHFIQALYHAGMREKADEILFKMIATFEREYTHSGLFPGYLRSVDWRTKGGEPCGYNYLADNYYFLLAAVTGHYGIEFPKLKKPE